MRLTTPMRDTLEHAVRQELRRVHDTEKPEWPAHPSTLAALVRHELLTATTRRSKRGHRLDVWTITETGRKMLEPKERFIVERPTYLARPSKTTGDYTHDPSRRIDPLPVLPEASPEWREHAALRRAAAEDVGRRARRLSTSARRAA